MNLILSSLLLATFHQIDPTDTEMETLKSGERGEGVVGQQLSNFNWSSLFCVDFFFFFFFSGEKALWHFAFFNPSFFSRMFQRGLHRFGIILMLSPGGKFRVGFLGVIMIVGSTNFQDVRGQREIYVI